MWRAALCSLTLAASCREPLSPLDPSWRAEPPDHFPLTAVGARSAVSLNLIDTSRAPVFLELEVDEPFEIVPEVKVFGGNPRALELSFAPTRAGHFEEVLHVQGEGQSVDLPLVADAQSPGVCPAHDACAIESVIDAVCRLTAVPDGVSCSQACLQDARCVRGVCVGQPRSCDDGDACTADACDALTGNCLHPPAQCAASDDVCRVPICDATTGCGTVEAEDGTACGPADCSTAHVCIRGSCVVRGVPQGAACGEISPCQARGHCVSNICERPPATVLAPVWQTTNPVRFTGTVDAASNLYFVEGLSQNTVVSTTRDGAERWRVTSNVTDARVEWVSQGRVLIRLRRASLPNLWELRDATTGAFLWSISPDALAAAEHPGCPGLPTAYGRAPAPASDGAGTLFFVGGVFLGSSCARPNHDEQWLFAVDAANGAVKWQRSFFQDGTAGNGVYLVLDEQGRAFITGPDKTRAFDTHGTQLWESYWAFPGGAFAGNLVDFSSNVYDAATGALRSPIDAPFGAQTIDAQQVWTLHDSPPQLERIDLQTGLRRFQSAVTLPGAGSSQHIGMGTLLSSRGTLVALYREQSGASQRNFLAELRADGSVAMACELGSVTAPEVAESRPALKAGRLFIGNLSAFDFPGLDVASVGWVTQGGKVSRENRPR
jgi:hypothetical protein